MPHVLVAGKLHPSGIELLDASPGVTYDYVEEVSEPSYAPLIGKADGLVIRTQPLSAPTVARAERLKIVSRHGVGYDAVDLPSLNRNGIALAIVGDVNSVSVAEHAMMLLLAATKRLIRADRAVRDNEWGWRNRLEPSELAGRRLLILGFGRIGRHLARMAAAFGMDVRAYDPFLERQGWPEGPVAPASDLQAGLAWADAISVNVPKAERPVIGPVELSAMKPTVVLINTARGGVVDEAALIAALRDGRIAAAGIDVFDDEPPAANHPLFGFDQVILTPHIAGLTAECGERMAISSVQNVLDFFAGRIDSALVVNGAELNGR
ncbi:hydroxyacid dehydrogenase [Mesorhizobium ventifaucium]|uniref:Phosphoglycerate dehydrogenase-like oxidoreductase n=1 Tax=Mesorhizobium ventifaucium TaxID=666020 RepID=A0ABN8KES8_9HYPH|nr:hydroxyacid dehydrogenase [Mesorhizobium ventifaucium]CAH2408252.1 Phosphoglycerate dehydrogenase-like oxidoreductase [Mesorhizobium ventifaucium]